MQNAPSTDSTPPLRRRQRRQAPGEAGERPDHGPVLMTALMLIGVAWTIARWQAPIQLQSQVSGTAQWVDTPEPLVMEGGDPYIRALMRTISAAESNMDQPYHLLYGGELIDSLERHPDLCVTIVAGPNTGDCTTAAGRYQFLTTTWQDKAARYHPRLPAWYNRRGEPSFEPEFQDAVVYRWLSDASTWGVDIGDMLRQGRLPEVLEMLSGTWTSLGYGIETNSMSAHLPNIYEAMLAEELR